MDKHVSRLLMMGLLALAGLLTPAILQAQERQNASLVLSVQADQETYLPGTAVQLTVSLANPSGTAIKAGRPDPENGTLTLYLAFGEQPFQRYTGPDWNTRSALFRPVAEFAAGQTFSVQTTMLYHRLQPTSHLNELYARPLREAQLNDYFALNRAGQYRVKAVFYDCVSKTKIESAPLALTVREPLGLDALIWDRIKNDGAAAFLLHTGGFKQGRDTAEARQAAEQLQRLLTTYPDSVYAVRLQSRMSKRQAEEQ